MAKRTLLYNDEERSLLLAALSSDRAVVADAWRYWRRSVDLDTAPGAQYPMFPVLYANLARLGLDRGLDGRLKGIYRRAWVRIQQQKALAETLLPILADAGAPACLTGDAAIALDLYPVRGARSVEQLALLVADAHVDRALQALRGAGWVPAADPPVLTNPSLRRWLDAAAFHRADQPSINLRWRITPTGPAFEQRSPQAHLALDLHLTPPRINPACQLVLAGERCAQGGNGRLIAASDLAMALRVVSGTDWDNVLELARMLRVARPLIDALTAVALLRAASPPSDAMERLLHLASTERSYPSLPAPEAKAFERNAAQVSYHMRRWQRLSAVNHTRLTPRHWLAYVQAASDAPQWVDLPRSLSRKLRGDSGRS